MMQATYGLILAGGLSRRMGGGDKPLRPVGGKPILARVIERLAPQCVGLLLNANGDPGRFAAYGLPIVPDDIPGFAGPLAGVLAGLDWLAHRRADADWAVSVPGDTPFVPTDLVSGLHRERAASGAQLVCAASGGRTHPVIALWTIGLRQELRTFLVEEGERKVGAFAARYGAASVAWPTEPFDPFFNANTTQDIAEAESIAQRLVETGA